MFQIVGCAIEVLNSSVRALENSTKRNGGGVRARTIRFGTTSFGCLQTAKGELIPDVIAFDSVVVDTKVIDQITDQNVG